MTIDTSREAVELRLTRLRAAYEEFRAPYGHIAALITQAKLTETMMDALLAERDAALAEVARLSTPPDDAEVAEIDGHLHDIINCGHCSGSRQSARKARAALTRLSRALAAETAKREAMEAALRDVLHETGGGTRATNNAVATLAKHGSKT